MNNLSKKCRSACGANMRPGGVNLRDYIIGASEESRKEERTPQIHGRRKASAMPPPA